MDQNQITQEGEIPIYNLITLLPPAEAYIYFPPNEECKYYVGNKPFRRIFDGQIQLDTDDNARVDNFINQCEQNKQSLNSLWTRSLIMRFAQANQFDYTKTLKSMQEYESWLTTLPPKLDALTIQFLSKGVIYIQGRDCRFRPIIVLNPYRIELKQMPIEQQIQGLTYFLEVVKQTMFLPGQVENWIIIMDLNFVSVGLPIAALKQVMGYLQNNYRSRLYKMYLVNTTMAISLLWKTIRPFLEENTGQKIIFSKDKLPELFEHTNKAQIEVKFGGTAPNKESHNYWPPLLNTTDIQIEQDKPKLISVEMYKVLYEQGKLENNKINQQYIQSNPES